jgi:hypothetical protein
MQDRPSLLRDDRGVVLSATFLVVMLWLVLGGATLGYSQLDLRSTSHFTTGNQALFSAEAGLVHSLRQINSVGVIRFDDDIANRWTELFGTEPRGFEGFGSSYEVTIAIDANDPDNRGILTATGRAPLQARRTIRVTLAKSGYTEPPGAVHFTADAPQVGFNGNAFDISGNNHDKLGAASGGAAVAGMSARTEAAASDIAGDLDSSQAANVRGLGYSTSPLTPSVQPTNGPGTADVAQMVADILATAGVVHEAQNDFTGSQTFGSLAVPQITHLSHNAVTVSGSITGAGILIADGSLTIGGSLDFVGWVIVGGGTVIDSTASSSGTSLGQATILGSLWTSDLAINSGGSAILNYCRECLELADDIVPGSTHLIPRAMTVTSWSEVF